MSDIADPLAWVERGEEDYAIVILRCGASRPLPIAPVFMPSSVRRNT